MKMTISDWVESLGRATFDGPEGPGEEKRGEGRGGGVQRQGIDIRFEARLFSGGESVQMSQNRKGKEKS